MVGWTIIYVVIAILALVMVYAIMRWSKFKKEATPHELRVRDEATRENFDKIGTKPGESMPADGPGMTHVDPAAPVAPTSATEPLAVPPEPGVITPQPPPRPRQSSVPSDRT
jgi:hypothetical protein